MANIEVPFETLLGKTLVSVRNVDDGEILFETKDGDGYMLYHEQDCCENVYVEDICGDLDDLLGSPLLLAEEVDSGDPDPLDKDDESYTWTFYKLSTNKGSVTIRWYGESNGYYSESVDFKQYRVGNIEKFILNAKLENKKSERSLVNGLTKELRRDPDKYRPYFLNDPSGAYYYAILVDRGPRDDTRTAACMLAKEAYYYAACVDKKPHDETRKACLREPIYAFKYASEVDKCPRDDTREAVCKDPEWALHYILQIDKRPYPNTFRAVRDSSRLTSAMKSRILHDFFINFYEENMDKV